MIRLAYGNILDSKCVALCNPVNCVGIMGAGLAKQFKERHPLNFEEYAKYCKAGKLVPGGCFTYRYSGPRYLLNVATKGHWKESSSMGIIRTGLQTILEEVGQHNIQSIAIPLLGAGLGALSPTEVKAEITGWAQTYLTEILIEIWLPSSLEAI